MKDNTNQIRWQNPQIWTHKGYKCLMYQSNHQTRSWRLLDMIRPDGSQVNDPEIPSRKTHSTPYNISSSRKKAERWLRKKIDWDQMPQDQKEVIKNHTTRLIF
jgi:hypothetical protein